MQYRKFDKWIWGVTAVLLSCVACSDDLQTAEPQISDNGYSYDENKGNGVSPQGKFIISYSLNNTETATRASDEQANRHIQSLDYYVYDQDGTLYKQRHIRGINSSTHWPISNRDSMSWELRQDLQDTLPDGQDYHILFIANVAPSLFQKIEGTDGKLTEQKIVIDEQEYNTARILLPRESLTDNTMFYMWEDTIKRADPKNATESSLKYSNIVLRRIVTRTDFMRSVQAQTPELPGTDAHLYKAISDGFYKDYKVEVENKVSQQIDEFCNSVKKEVIDYTEKDGYPFYGENGEAAKLNAFIIAHKADIAAEVERKILTQYVKKIKENGYIWKQANAWEGMNVEVIYSPDCPQANALGFDRKVYALPDINACRTYTVDSKGLFSIIGFAEGENFNRLTGLKFSGTDNFEIKNAEYNFTQKQKLNTWWDVVCNPISNITLIPGEFNTDNSTTTVAIDTLLGYMPVDESGMTFSQLLEVKGEKTSGLDKGWYTVREYIEKYVKKTFSAFQFEFNKLLPDLNKNVDKKIKATPSWQTQRHQ